MVLQRGTSVGPYEIVSRLGAGGMGEVYRARDPRLNREVAIKVLTEEAARDRDRLRRFIAEAKAASALNHPNILTVHEIGETDGGPYIVTELVSGRTVRELLSEEALPFGRALDIAIQTADGIGKAHEAGIVHRDLKPENLMFTEDGFVKILDFGLAKLIRPDASSGDPAAETAATQTGVIVGTAGYLSPEQLRGTPADGRSDVFALGVVLYEMVSGANPFRRDNSADTFSAILRDEPPPLSDQVPGVPEELSAAVRKALAKKPEDRHATARQFAGELRGIRGRMDSSLSATQFAPAPRGKGPRWLAPVLAAAAALLLTAALLLRGSRGDAGPTFASLPAGRLAVAVLPIQDQSGDPALSRAGISEILRNAFVQLLSDVPNLYVVSPLRFDGAAAELKRPPADAAGDVAFAKKVCKRAGAGAMLSGRLSRIGNTFVLDAVLTEMPSENLRASFQAKSADRDRLLPDLVGQVTGSLRQKLAPNAPAATLEQVTSTNVFAYERFIRGQDWNNEGEWQKAIPELKKALEIDPKMGIAWLELSCSYSFAGDDAASEAAFRQAEENLDHVNQKERHWIELNRIWVRTKNGKQYREAAQAYIREFPDERQGYFYMGLGQEYLEGDCRGALESYEMAYRLTPGYYPITKAIVDCRLKLKEKGRAIAALERYLKQPFLGNHGRQQAGWRLEEFKKRSATQAEARARFSPSPLS